MIETTSETINSPDHILAKLGLSKPNILDPEIASAMAKNDTQPYSPEWNDHILAASDHVHQLIDQKKNLLSSAEIKQLLIQAINSLINSATNQRAESHSATPNDFFADVLIQTHLRFYS